MKSLLFVSAPAVSSAAFAQGAPGHRVEPPVSRSAGEDSGSMNSDAGHMGKHHRHHHHARHRHDEAYARNSAVRS